ncbi:MAG: NUDIX hydrolase [Candidatus Nanopelagicales bacterium]
MPHSRPGRSAQPTVEETSAGGLLIDFDRDPLSAVIIGRYDRRGRMVWSLPKGHIEEGETREETAVREITEETGIEGQVLCELGTIDFTFVAEGRRIHKTVHHFLLERTGGEVSTEDIEVADVAWVALADVSDRLTYADERRLMARVPQLLADIP